MAKFAYDLRIDNKDIVSLGLVLGALIVGSFLLRSTTAAPLGADFLIDNYDADGMV
jgi:hypothetical protein